MRQEEIEAILRGIEELRPRRDCSPEERLRFLLKGRMLRRQLESGRVRGRVEGLLQEVNEIYKSEVGEDRIKESAKAIRIQLLWSSIQRRHTAATWQVQAGTNLFEAAGYLGMSPETLWETYGHHHPDYQSGAAKAVSRKARGPLVSGPQSGPRRSSKIVK